MYNLLYYFTFLFEYVYFQRRFIESTRSSLQITCQTGVSYYFTRLNLKHLKHKYKKRIIFLSRINFLQVHWIHSRTEELGYIYIYIYIYIDYINIDICVYTYNKYINKYIYILYIYIYIYIYMKAFRRSSLTRGKPILGIIYPKLFS